MSKALNIALIRPPNLDYWIPTKGQFQHWLQHAVDTLDNPLNDNYELCINLVSADEIKNINRQYRSENSATNVLSFAAESTIPQQLTPKPLGDLVLCPEIIELEAINQHKTIESHWTHICIHGLLHLLGYDHIDDAQAAIMEAIEVRCLDNLGIANPYI